MENKANQEAVNQISLYAYLQQKWFHTQRDIVKAIVNNPNSKYHSSVSLETLISKVLNYKRVISDQLFICLESVLFPHWEMDKDWPEIFTNHTREVLKKKHI